MNAAVVAGLVMSTLGLIGFLTLSLALISVMIRYSNQQVRMAMIQSQDRAVFEKGPRRSRVIVGSRSTHRAA